jgi:SpoVK/Ycf46/Vps4 family AAA+-type ATPase
MKPKLIFIDKVNQYLRNVIQSFVDFKNGDNLESDGYNDTVSPFLKRYNAVMYGAPGTGKTELVNELVHHLFEKFNIPEKTTLKKEIEKLEKELDNLKKKQTKVGQRSQQVTSQDQLIEKQIVDLENNLNPKKQRLESLEKSNRIPPVFKIDGAKLQTAGESLGQPSPETKLIKFIAYCKKEAFGDAFSKEPYVVFVEEADQGINVMTAGSGGKKNNLLEEYKNFLSTSEDKAGLKAGAQDPNSIIIIASNNYELIDPAVVRRGRLGEKLNFN